MNLEQFFARLLATARRLRPPPTGFFGDYPERAAAEGKAAGYTDASLIEALVQQQHEVDANPAPSVIDDRVMQLAFVLSRVVASANPVRVLDFGGALGFHESQARRLFPEARFEWVVVETWELAAAGAREFARPGLEFHDGIAAVADQSFDLVHASGALQYVPDAEATWSELASVAHRLLCLNRMPFIPRERDTFALQRAPAPGGGTASYASHFFAERPWRTRLRETHDVEAEWEVSGDRPYADRIDGIRYAGLLLRPRG